MRVTVIPVIVGALEMAQVSENLDGTIRNLRENRDYPDSSIVEIGLNNEKSPKNLRWFTVTQTSMKVHQLISKVGDLSRGWPEGFLFQ